MGLFDKIKEPVFLKDTTDAEEQINLMEEFAKTAPDDVKKKIDYDIRLIKAGIKGEENILFELKNSGMPMIIIRDLFLVSGELSAQIDFLIVTRKLSYIIECKNLFGNIEINSKGDFIRTVNYGGNFKKEGIYSPVTQNMRHLEVIRQIRRNTKTNLILKAIFDKYFEENYKSVVVLSNPKTIVNMKYAKKEIKDKVIRYDQLVEYIKNTNKKSKQEYMSERQMEELADFFLKINQKKQVDYTERYKRILETRLNLEPETSENEIQHDEKECGSILQETMPEEKIICPKCGALMVRRKAQKEPNAGNEFYGCSRYPKCRCIVNIKPENKKDIF